MLPNTELWTIQHGRTGLLKSQIHGFNNPLLKRVFQQHGGVLVLAEGSASILCLSDSELNLTQADVEPEGLIIVRSPVRKNGSFCVGATWLLYTLHTQVTLTQLTSSNVEGNITPAVVGLCLLLRVVLALTSLHSSFCQ